VADAPQEVIVKLERLPNPAQRETSLLAEAAANPNPFTEELTLRGSVLPRGSSCWIWPAQ